MVVVCGCVGGGGEGGGTARGEGTGGLSCARHVQGAGMQAGNGCCAVQQAHSSWGRPYKLAHPDGLGGDHRQ